VEDDPRNVAELRDTLVPCFAAGEIEICQSRDSALQALQNGCFDLVVLDRKLPTSDGALDEDVSHGETIYGYLKSEVPGVPIRFWTAFPDDDYYDRKMADVQQEDIWGTGEKPTVGLIPKSRFDRVKTTIAEVKAALEALDTIELRQRFGKQVDLTDIERRIVKIFAKRQSGTAIEVSALSGGYSSAKVLRAAVFVGVHQTHLTVGKITTLKELSGELRRFQQFSRLRPGAAPGIVCQVRAGAGLLGGTFYQLATGFDRSLFDVLAVNPQDGAKIGQAIRTLVQPWANPSTQRSGPVKELRRAFVSDDTFAEIAESLKQLNLERFEALEVTWMECDSHGDLHGENVLVNDTLTPILIDFGEAGIWPAAADPLALELSALFHRAGPLKKAGWPSADAAQHWFNAHDYLAACPYAPYVRACRDWAYDAAPGNRALYATAYAYLVRQFKYPDTDKDLAKALIGAVISGYSAT